MTKINIPDNLINDSEYTCENCEEKFMVFSESGTVSFCPSCAFRV